MSLSNYQLPVRSSPTTDFTEALLTNQGSATVNLKLPSRDPLWFIRAISIIATQNLDYELQLFTRTVNMGATLPTDYFNSVWQFGDMSSAAPAAAGYPFDPVDSTPSNGYYHYFIDGNLLPYYDLDQMLAANAQANVPLGQGVGNALPNNSSLHVRLINRSVTAKVADAGGALLVTFFVANQGRQA